jgi:2-C-methyl-D-erythritol 4-phosphate cytidylyltransferase
VKASVVKNIVNRIIDATRPLIEKNSIRSLYCAACNRDVLTY